MTKQSNRPEIHTCHLGIPMNLVEELQSNEDSYIHEHLQTLFFIVKEFNCQHILEIGTGNGESTFAMALAMNRKGLLISMDIERKADIIDKALDNKLSNIMFTVDNSKTTTISGEFDLVFIDGSHEEEDVYQDIKKFAPMVKPNGFLILHDVSNPKWGSDVRNAMLRYKDDITKNRINIERLWRMYNWFNCNGLAIWRKL